jgi:lipopolysaccharide assembly outer membrane protein LptD (OstA)
VNIRHLLCVCLTLSLATLAAPAAPTDTSPRQSVAMPALGENAILEMDSLVVESATNQSRALGNVVIRSASFNLDCDELVYSDFGGSMLATGERVQFEMGDITAICEVLDYNLETGGITLSRLEESRLQPCVIQNQGETTFTAFANHISIEPAEDGETVTQFEGHVQMRTAPTE